MNAAQGRQENQSRVVQMVKPSPWPPANELCDLLKVAYEAVQIEWSMLPFSIGGPPSSWIPPFRRYSEYNIIDPWRLITTVRYLSDIAVPALPETTPDLARTLLPPVVTRRFWRPTGFFRQADEYGGVSSFPDEHWFFINGIATNTDVARFNSRYLAHLFHRPVTVVQNATRSVMLDLHECIIGKGFQDREEGTVTEPAWRATAAILEALNAGQTERVVVIAHSQGTIITANVLHMIANALQFYREGAGKYKWHPFTQSMMGEIETETQKILRNSLAHALSEFTKHGPEVALERLGKLEIYTFANCADHMRYVIAGRQIPYMEHFANEFDIVARLGILSPLRDSGQPLIEIDGPVFEQESGLGHLLNEHYLMPIDDYLYPGARAHRRKDDPFTGRGPDPAKPRLYGYFHGKRPEPVVH
ncbi:MAG: hypothetical protein OES53_11060 [Xanthomonadales bacterium]|nr:hypothetical protein [Xanthomonadales bacterium]MDH3941897.1 hypothetical protein [Xanthomonadales bacterium]MDH4002821.1 hypothetical protein [Xanthomonadales bacterium]